VPLFSGDKVGFNSSIHQDQVNIHLKAFKIIENIAESIDTGVVSAPSYVVSRNKCQLEKI
jgi:hypothetical protein